MMYDEIVQESYNNGYEDALEIVTEGRVANTVRRTASRYLIHSGAIGMGVKAGASLTGSENGAIVGGLLGYLGASAIKNKIFMKEIKAIVARKNLDLSMTDDVVILRETLLKAGYTPNLASRSINYYIKNIYNGEKKK